jgi:hypothetical protein
MMYSGNGGGNGGNYTRIGGYPIKPLYLYIGLALIAVVAIYFVLNIFTTQLVMHFGAYAGLLLLIANVRELLGNSYGQKGSTALLNVLIGAALLCAWLSQIITSLLWIPALILVAIATPLIFGRARVYTAYLDTARTIAGSVRRTIVR